MTWIYDIAVTLHVLAALSWVGGVLFIGTVALPASRQMPDRRGREAIAVLGRRFRPVGWTALAVLVATGTYMMGAWGATPANVLDGRFFAEGTRARMLGWKLLLVLAMLTISGVHDWYLGPKASSDPDDDEGLRRWAAVLGSATALLSVGIVILAVLVARPWMIG